MENIFDQIEANMDNLVDNQVWWSNCATGRTNRSREKPG